MKTKVAVTTVSFSNNEELIKKLRSHENLEVVLNPHGRRLTPGELVELLQPCAGAIVGLDKIHSEVLKQVPNLQVISKYGVGLDNINFEDCEKHDVKVVHTQGVNKRSVAEMTLGFMLMLGRNLYATSNLHKRGKWQKSGGIQLSEKTVGIIGFGNIGQEVAALLKPFGCKLLVNDIADKSQEIKEHGAVSASKEEIFAQADFVTLHTPLTDQTENLINSKVLEKLKNEAFVINTARGGVVNEEDLKIALITGEIAGAALDAYVVEPPKDQELVSLPNLVCTPHIGGNAREAVQAMGEAAILNLVEALAV